VKEKSEGNILTQLPQDLFLVILKFLDGISLARLLRVNKYTNDVVKKTTSLCSTKEQGRIDSCYETTLKLLPKESKSRYKVKGNTIDSPQKMFSNIAKEKVKTNNKSKSFNASYKKAQINIYKHLTLEDREKIRKEQEEIIKKQNKELASFFQIKTK
jgi:hypothetical protein